jgi:hypothetical protein
MSLHEQIATDINDVIEQHGGVDAIGPTSVALILHNRYGGQEAELHLAYASLEHLKHMARARLGKRFGSPTGTAAEAQGELFANALQERYPIQTPKGEEPIYKLTSALTHDELLWNAARLEKAGKTLLEHSRALKSLANERAALPANDSDTKAEAA